MRLCFCPVSFWKEQQKVILVLSSFPRIVPVAFFVGPSGLLVWREVVFNPHSITERVSLQSCCCDVRASGGVPCLSVRETGGVLLVF